MAVTGQVASNNIQSASLVMVDQVVVLFDVPLLNWEQVVWTIQGR